MNPPPYLAGWALLLAGCLLLVLVVVVVVVGRSSVASVGWKVAVVEWVRRTVGREKGLDAF